MQVLYNEGLANHIDSESCGYDRKVISEALTGESMGRDIEPRKRRILQCADAVLRCGRQHRFHRQREMGMGTAWSKTPSTYGNSLHGNRDIPYMAREVGRARAVNPMGARRR
jgi:hypothetical protein